MIASQAVQGKKKGQPEKGFLTVGNMGSARGALRAGGGRGFRRRKED